MPEREATVTLKLSEWGDMMGALRCAANSHAQKLRTFSMISTAAIELEADRWRTLGEKVGRLLEERTCQTT